MNSQHATKLAELAAAAAQAKLDAAKAIQRTRKVIVVTCGVLALAMASVIIVAFVAEGAIKTPLRFVVMLLLVVPLGAVAGLITRVGLHRVFVRAGVKRLGLVNWFVQTLIFSVLYLVTVWALLAGSGNLPW